MNSRFGCRGRCPKFAVYGIPLCRASDAEAQSELQQMVNRIDPDLLAKRRTMVDGAKGMWAEPDLITMLDTNEGYATGLIGSRDTILKQVQVFRDIGVDMLHLTIGDHLFEEAVLPEIHKL